MSDSAYHQYVTDDAQDHASRLSDWNQHYEQLSVGTFIGRFENLDLGGVHVFRETANRSLYQSGRARAGIMTAAVTWSPAEDGWFCGHPLRGVSAIALSASGEFELVAGAGMDLVSVSIDESVLNEPASTLLDDAQRAWWRRPTLLEGGRFEASAFKALLDAALACARQPASTLSHRASRRMLASSLCEAMLRCLPPDAREAPLPAGARARREIVARAREYMARHAEEVIGIVDLCRATGASRRTLQYAFNEVMGLSPMIYLRVMRLNRARADMRRCFDETLGDIAARWGFWHLSRFAADYRELFGELPSTTRARALAARRCVPAIAEYG
ncbi:MAG: helix-turn-helix domain-containing protein [Burkholderiaceae bacterium]